MTKIYLRHAVDRDSSALGVPLRAALFFSGLLAIGSYAAPQKPESAPTHRDPIVITATPHVDAGEIRIFSISSIVYWVSRAAVTSYGEFWKKDLGMIDGDAEALIDHLMTLTAFHEGATLLP